MQSHTLVPLHTSSPNSPFEPQEICPLSLKLPQYTTQMDQLSSQSLSVAEMTCFFLQPEDLDLDTLKLTPVSPVPSMNSAFPKIHI